MKKLFNPAIDLMNRLNYPQKFILISFFFILPLALVLLLLIPSLNDSIKFTQKELYGLTYLRPLRRLLEHSLQNKMLAHNYLAGNGALREARLDKQAQIDEDFRALEAVDRELGEVLKMTGVFEALQASWQTLKDESPGLETSISDERHNQFITALRAAISLVGGNSNLILDPDLDSYYLMDILLLKLPEGQALLAQISLLGDQTLDEGKLTVAQQEQFIVLTGLLQSNLKATKNSLEVALRNSSTPNLEPGLSHTLQEFSVITETSLWALRRELLNSQNPPSPEVQEIYSTLANQALMTSFNLWDRTIIELEALLQARMARFSRRTYLVAITTGLGLFLAVYLWVGFYLAVMRTVSTLDEASQRMAAGSLNPMVSLENKDELGQVTLSFNKIAIALIKAQAELEQRVEERTIELSSLNEQLKAEIVERRRAEIALQENQAFLNNIYIGVGLAIFVIDVTGDGAFRYVGVNPTYEQMVGLKSADLEGRTLEELVPIIGAEAVAEVRRNYEQCLQTGQILYKENYVVWQNKERWYLDQLTPIHDAEGRVRRIIGSTIDTTQIKQAEAALSRYAGRLEVLHEIDRSILAARSPEEIAQKALRYLRQFVPCQRAGLSLFDFETNEIVIIATDVDNETQLKRGSRLPLIGDDLLKELQQGKIFELSDVRLLSIGDLLFSEGIRAGISLPLIVNELLIGVVNLWATSSDSFSDEHKNIAREVADQLAIAIQQARLHAETEQRAEHLAVLHELDRAITASLNLDDVYRAFARHALRLLPCDHMSIGLVENEQLLIIFSEEKGLTKTVLPLKTLSGAAWVMAHGQPLLSQDLHSDQRFPPNQLAITLGLRSVMILPLRIKGQTIGAWFLGRRQTEGYQPNDLTIAQSMADQLAIALENVRLFEQVQRYAGELEQRVADRTRELSALYEITAVASEALDLPTTLERSLTRVLGAMRSQVGVIHLLDETEKTLHLRVQQGLPADLAARLESLPAGVGLPGWVMETGAPFIVPDVALEPKALQEGQLNFQAYIGSPIRARGQTVGVLSVARAREQPQFNVEEVALLTTIADQVGVIVESARLRHLAEQSAVMEERARLARDLHDSVTQLLYSLNLFAAVGRGAYNQGDMAQVNACLNDLEMIALQALKEMRLLVYELRPLALTQEGLASALQRRLEAVERRANVRTQLQVDINLELPRAVEEALYHISQEALNNALKHAAATAVTVRIETVERRIALEVSDNGSGFEPQGKGGLGLVSMRERVENLGGALTILSAPGQGTKIRASLEVPV